MGLLERVEELVKGFSGRVAVAARDLRGGDSVYLHATDQLPTASMIKLPVLLELFRQHEEGRFSLDESIELREEDKCRGSGLLRGMSAGIRLPIRDYAFLMMNVSDNSATNVLIDLVGIENVQRTLAREDFAGIELRHKIDFTYLWDDPAHLGVGTAYDFMRLMERVYTGTILTPTSCQEMLRMMRGVGPERIPRYLPYNPYARDMAARGLWSGPAVETAGKTGALVGVRGHVAVVWGEHVEFVLAAMTADCRDHGWSVDHEGSLLIARIAHEIYKEWGSES